MKQRRLYGDTALIEQLLQKFKLMETSEGGWAAVYQDTSTKQFWLKYYATSGTPGGGYLMLLRLPLPTTEELINIALTSTYQDEAVAAVLRLLNEEEIEKKDFRLTMINQIGQLQQKQLLEEDKKQLQKVIKLASLDDPINRRSVEHKSVKQVEEDAAYFRSIADRAKQLLALLA